MLAPEVYGSYISQASLLFVQMDISIIDALTQALRASLHTSVRAVMM